MDSISRPRLLKSDKKQTNGERGTAIYIAIFALSAIMMTALTVSTIAVGESRIAKETADSMQAVYVADSVMEYTMTEIRKNADSSPLTASSNTTFSTSSCSTLLRFSNISSGEVKCKAKIYNDIAPDDSYSNCKTTLPLGVDCTRIVGTGTFGGNNRVIEIVFPNL